MKKKNKRELKVPFYAQLLSRQEMLHAGGAGITRTANDQAQTAKAPSDQEDTSLIGDQVNPMGN